MSTTVTYKGSTLTTVNNETKVLNTAGTWVEGDISITDASSGITPTGTVNISTNGTHDVTQYASAAVAVPTGVDLPVFTLTYNEVQDEYSVTCNKTFAECQVLLSDTVYGAILIDGSSKYILSGIADDNNRIWYAHYIGENIDYDIIYYSNGSIEYVYPSSLSLTLNATSNGTYTADDEGRLGVYTEVNVNVPTGTARTSSDLTVSGATVTAPAGLYSGAASATVASGTAGTPTATKGTVSNHSIAVTPSVTNTTGYITGGTVNGTAVTVTASELVSGTLTIDSSGTKDVTNYASASVASGSATTPATTITANPSISVNSSGLITASASASQNVTPTVSAGYVSTGTAGTVTVTGSNTSQLTTQAATTITPTKSSQTAVTAGKYTTGAVTVAAIPAEYITTTDATAAASDIISGETAYVNGSKVTGTLTFQTIYSGSSDPSSSTGANGDIYIKVVS